MKSRFGIAAFVAILLALPITVVLASANPYPVGKATLSGVGISGTAFVTRQLTAAQTHVALRASGLTPGRVIAWQIVGGAFCGATPTSTLMTQVGSTTASTQGTVMVSEYQAVTLNVTSGSAMMTVRLYDYST